MGVVAYHAITGNPVKEGTIVISTQKNGVNMNVNNTFLIPNSPDTTVLDTGLYNRFDHPRYYSYPS